MDDQQTAAWFGAAAQALISLRPLGPGTRSLGADAPTWSDPAAWQAQRSLASASSPIDLGASIEAATTLPNPSSSSPTQSLASQERAPSGMILDDLLGQVSLYSSQSTS